MHASKLPSGPMIHAVQVLLSLLLLLTEMDSILLSCKYKHFSLERWSRPTKYRSTISCTIIIMQYKWSGKKVHLAVLVIVNFVMFNLQTLFTNSPFISERQLLSKKRHLSPVYSSKFSISLSPCE